MADGKEFAAPVEDGWIVLLRRQDGSVNFTNKLWDDYKYGFGELAGEFWLGNENIHSLAASAMYTVRFDLVTFNKTWSYAEYRKFYVQQESEQFQLIIGSYSGNVSDGFTTNTQGQSENMMKFSTKDRDNDKLEGACCCGGWWFNACGYVRLTGDYGRDGYEGIMWYPFDTNLAYADMKIMLYS
ncbi:hypothetical protein LSH36_1094g00030 [Paralvinella palmiformis]|uniref:Fibrinogen C-terminal domain-containing protein n=1 Tax=Paralvinella palmiformis TaxID=53620 RepID=A0AAD9IUZ2_9ANNE|nr:hypothetical protein LSH36_1094g00030 [Paralvinella palmiformis]